MTLSVTNMLFTSAWKIADRTRRRGYIKVAAAAEAKTIPGATPNSTRICTAYHRPMRIRKAAGLFAAVNEKEMEKCLLQPSRRGLN
jgi:hypothetical protein